MFPCLSYFLRCSEWPRNQEQQSKEKHSQEACVLPAERCLREKNLINKNQRKQAKHPGTVAVPNIWEDELGEWLELRSLWLSVSLVRLPFLLSTLNSETKPKQNKNK